MRVLFAIILLLFSVSTAHAQKSADELLTLAIESLAKGDQNAAKRYLKAILKMDPRNPEALWQLTWQSVSHLKSKKPEQRAHDLYLAGPAAIQIARLAKHRGDQGLAHYIMARYAWLHNAFDRALREIDLALDQEPDSTRYLITKATLLAAKGDWENDDDLISAGIKLIEKARQQHRDFPTIHWRTSAYHIARAEALADLSDPPWDKIVEAYELAIVTGNYTGTALAYKSNSLSWAYRRAGRCQDAKASAITTLAITKIKSAKRNLNMALFCLEMQNLGLLAKEPVQ